MVEIPGDRVTAATEEAAAGTAADLLVVAAEADTAEAAMEVSGPDIV